MCGEGKKVSGCLEMGAGWEGQTAGVTEPGRMVGGGQRIAFLRNDYFMNVYFC